MCARAVLVPCGGGGCVKSVLYRTLSVRDLYFIFAYIGLYLYFICTRSVLYRRVHRTKSVLYRRVHRAYIARTSGSSDVRIPPLYLVRCPHIPGTIPILRSQRMLNLPHKPFMHCWASKRGSRFGQSSMAVFASSQMTFSCNSLSLQLSRSF